MTPLLICVFLIRADLSLAASSSSPFFLNTCFNLLDKQQIEEIIGVDLTHSVLRFNCKANDGLIQTTDQETSIPEQLRRKYHD